MVYEKINVITIECPTCNVTEYSTAFEAVLTVCQNSRCRIVLRMLAEEQRPLTLNEITEAVFEKSDQTPNVEVSEDILTEIKLSLYHVHLPKLSSEGFVNYDSKRQLVEPIKQLEQVDQTLSTILGADATLKPSMER